MHWWCTDDALMQHLGGMHFVYGASPQHILLHFPIKLLHLPIKFASFPQQIASYLQQFASFPQHIASFPQHSFSLPQHILCHFAKNRIKVFFCDIYSFFAVFSCPQTALQEFQPDSTRFFCPSQLGSAVEISWYKLQNKKYPCLYISLYKFNLKHAFSAV